MARIPTVVFDLDGVIRQWNDDELDEVEASYGLEPRTILTVAFSAELGHAAVTGRLTHPQWMAAIRARVIAEHGADVIGALDEWELNVGRVDVDMLAVVRAARRRTGADARRRPRDDLSRLRIDDVSRRLHVRRGDESLSVRFFRRPETRVPMFAAAGGAVSRAHLGSVARPKCCVFTVTV